MLPSNKIKDCLFGQIRAVNDNVFRETGIDKTATPTTIPAALQPYVMEQQIITWDNDTGMNPLYDQVPTNSDYAENNFTYESYGNMLQKSYEIAESNGITFIQELIPYLSVSQYHEKIQEDYKNDYSLLCASLGFWWHINLFLNHYDTFFYDYITLRQHDTWYHPGLVEEQVVKIFEETDARIPTLFATRVNTINYPTTAFIQAFFYMFNKAAVDQLKDDFYVLILKEIDHYYKTLSKYSQPIYGKSGVILYNVCTKNNIDIVDVDQLIGNIFCWIPKARSPDCRNYGRLERNVPAVDI